MAETEPTSVGRMGRAITGGRTLIEGLGFAEGPRWRDGALWVSDIAAREILCIGLGGEVLRRIETPGRPSGLGWLPDGRMLAVMMDERVVLRLGAGEWATHADLSHFTAAALNDMVVGSSGCAYVTGLGYVAGDEEPRETQIVLVRPDGSYEVQPHPLWRPNGCVISPDGSELIVAETRYHRLTRFDIDAEGRLHDGRPFAELPRGTWADGICLDMDGGVWIGDPKSRTCWRVGDDGRVSDSIETDPTPCIACALGGEHGRTLFLLLSELGDFDDLDRRRQGRIETFIVDVPGAGSP